MKKLPRRFSACILLLIAVFFTTDISAAIRRVAPGGNGITGPGTAADWSDAYSSLQAAIDASSSGDEVWVAAGSYQPALNGSFVMKEGVAIYGGFTGTETLLSERNWTANTTTLLGNGSSVVFNQNNALTAAAILDGFTVTGGSAVNGGGIYNQSASPTLRNLVVTANVATSQGAGIYNYVASPTMTRITVSDNSLTQSPGYGGGIANWFSNSVCSLLVVINNTGENGAGMFNYLSNITITRSVIAGNEGNYGAGMFNQSSGPQLVNVIFSGNIATQAGGANYNQGSSPGPSFTNCTFVGNTASSVTVGGGAIANGASVITVTNSIFWANTSVAGPADIHDLVSSTSTVTYSITQVFGTDGVNGNLVGSSYDPLFVYEGDPDGPDNKWLTADDGLRIQLGSPAIDAGASGGAPATDASNYARPYGPGYDIGAYEYSLDYPLPVTYSYFKAFLTSENKVLLQWQTVQEQNSSFFRVLRATEDPHYEAIGMVNAAGNSALPLTYSYTDDIAGITADKLLYKLEQVDIDGRRMHSNIVAVSLSPAAAGIAVFPNPVTGAAFTVTIDRFTRATPYLIRDITGTIVQSGMITSQTQLVHAGRLPRGIYLFEINDGPPVKLVKH